PTIKELHEIVWDSYVCRKLRMPEDHSINDEPDMEFLFSLRSKNRNTVNNLFINSLFYITEYTILLESSSFGQTAKTINRISLELSRLAQLIKEALLEIELHPLDRMPLMMSEADTLRCPPALRLAYKHLNYFARQASEQFLPMVRKSKLAPESPEAIKKEINLQKTMLKRQLSKLVPPWALLARSDALAYYLEQNFLVPQAKQLRQACKDIESLFKQINYLNSEGMPPEGTAKELLDREVQKRIEAFSSALDAILQESKQQPEQIGTEQGIKSVEKPKAENWEQIIIEIVDDNTVKYKVNNKKWDRANYTELGFLDKRSNKSNKLWPIFLGLANKKLPTDISRPKMKPKDIDRICQTLRDFFGPKDRPIKYNKKAKEYCFSFTFNDPREWMSILQNENLSD
ncbi:MAG: hypothetical protein V3W45_06490, partial [Sedimentisphaerales bacterium]